MKKNIIISIGVFFSLVINILVNFKNETISPNRYGIFLFITFPIILAALFTAISIFIKLILFDGPSFQKWDCKEAYYIAINNKSTIKKILAKIYLIIDFPTLFLGGYMMGCSFFAMILIFYKK